MQEAFADIVAKEARASIQEFLEVYNSPGAVISTAQQEADRRHLEQLRRSVREAADKYEAKEVRYRAAGEGLGVRVRPNP